jgi:hypothetical protein
MDIPRVLPIRIPINGVEYIFECIELHVGHTLWRADAFSSNRPLTADIAYPDRPTKYFTLHEFEVDSYTDRYPYKKSWAVRQGKILKLLYLNSVRTKESLRRLFATLPEDQRHDVLLSLNVAYPTHRDGDRVMRHSTEETTGNDYRVSNTFCELIHTFDLQAYMDGILTIRQEAPEGETNYRTFHSEAVVCRGSLNKLELVNSTMVAPPKLNTRKRKRNNNGNNGKNGNNGSRKRSRFIQSYRRNRMNGMNGSNGSNGSNGNDMITNMFPSIKRMQFNKLSFD